MRQWIARVAALRQSMLAQMLALTVIFIGWGLYSFAIQPLLDAAAEPETAPDFALSLTRNQVSAALVGFVSAQGYPGSGPARPEDDPVVRAAMAANPGFRFYAHVGDQSWGNGRPHWFDRLRIADLTQAVVRPSGGRVCLQASSPPEMPGGDYYLLTGCDRIRFVEFSGLNTPIHLAETSPAYALATRYWYFFNDFLIAAGGMFLIFLLVLLVHLRMVRRMSSIAGSFDPRNLNQKLPETGLATEFVPLVRAVNALIARVDEGQRRKTVFLSAAAHEMRTPLAVLRTRLELMEEGPTRDLLIADLRRLIDLVNQLLSLMTIGARGETAGLVDIVGCCRDVVGAAADAAAERQVELAFLPALPFWETVGDAALVRSAVANVVANAISFAPPGTAVEIAIDRTGTVRVRDHGPGVSHADPAALFEPFVRGPVTRPGFGLGLAIVKEVAELHGGGVSVRNAPGGGALFVIRFAPEGEPD